MYVYVQTNILIVSLSKILLIFFCTNKDATIWMNCFPFLTNKHDNIYTRVQIIPLSRCRLDQAKYLIHSWV